ncbi:MAG TPA: OmpH family outer membrane protein [Planctomycetota bacterium]|nr:OmpH family outer membrane protein [Planctomycetota bacterium]
MRTWSRIVVGVALGVLLSTAFYVTAAPRGILVPARIGVVDFRQLLDGYQKMTDLEKDIITTQQKLREEADKRREEIQQLGARLAMHTPGSKAYADTESAITTKKAELDTWGKVKTSELLNRERDIIREVYRDLEDAAAAYAKVHGLGLILKSDRLELTAPSVRELDLRVTLKKLLYVGKEMDITDDLVALLNARYQKERTAKELDGLKK